MSREEIVKMLSDIVSVLDYDLYKDIFVYGEDDQDVLEELVEIANSHVNTDPKEEI